MTEQDYQSMVDSLKRIASGQHCYERNSGEYEYPEHKWDVFEDGADYGEILLARTILEGLGVKFEYPCMREND